MSDIQDKINQTLSMNGGNTDAEKAFYEMGYKSGYSLAQEQLLEKDRRITELENVLRGYEDWEAMIISEDKMWWPQMAKDVMTNEIYEKMLELQQKRNAVLNNL